MRIEVVSTSRADVGALRPVYDALLATGHRVTWSNAETESSGDVHSSSAYIASGVVRFVADRVADSAPDLVVLLGDRYETLAVATSAYLMGLPIAHLSGGDITEGSQDDSMRHAITKLSHLHFATHRDSADRIIQMGEDPSRVHVTGCPGIDSLLSTKLLSKEETIAAAGLIGCKDYFLVSLHPNTLANYRDKDREMVQLLAALEIQRKNNKNEIGFVLTSPNQDEGRQLIEDSFRKYSQTSHVVYHENLDRTIYLSLMKHCIALVGNSSAGFYEAPSLGTKVINIGDRQQGRIPSIALRDCPPNAYDIYGYMRAAELDYWPKSIPYNPYGDGKASERIVKIISGIKDPKALLRKKFYTKPDLPHRSQEPIMKSGMYTVTAGGSVLQQEIVK